MTITRAIIWSALFLTTGWRAPAYCQSVPIPDGPPVFEMQVHQAPVLFTYPYGTEGRWATEWNPPSPMTPELVAQIVVSYPRQRPLYRYQSPSSPPPEGTEFSGRIWQFGRSGRFTNTPSHRGYHVSGYRMDCFKKFPEPFGNNNPAMVLEGHNGEAPTPIDKLAYPVAHSVFVRFSGAQAVAVRHDVDYGTTCMMGATGMMCMNTACARYALCETPWVYPNVPCTSCGVPGYDSTAVDFGLYQYTSFNTWLDYDAWQRPTVENLGMVENPGTPAQAITNAGTPFMACGLVQRVSLSEAPYNVPGQTVAQYEDGLYAEVIDQLKLYKGTNYPDGSRKYLGTFRIRRWLLWENSPAGLFDFLGDWFAGDAHAGRLDGVECCEATDIFAFLTEWLDQ